MQSRIAPPSSDSMILGCPEIPDLPGGKLKNFAAGGRLVEAGEEAAESAVPEPARTLPWLRRYDN
jgi:hypothetical protein